jgi:tRNA (guanine37-N1)-methyltransferase
MSDGAANSTQPAIDVLSIFPQTVRAVLDSSILRRAQLSGRVTLESSDLRNFTEDKYRSVDDTPFGGRQGMLFTAPILERAMNAQLEAVGGERQKLKVIYPSPRGIRVEQPVLEAMAEWMGQTPGSRLCCVCGRYEGVDERFIDKWVDLELSLGDFVLTGGELVALSIVDGIVRLMPGVLGDARSPRDESFSNGLLEYPQYTKPREFGGLDVPEALLGGDHKEIEEWKLRQSLLLTQAFRPDLIRNHSGAGLPLWARELLEKLKARLDLRT